MSDEQQDQHEEHEEPGSEGQEGAAGNREAAKYRTRLREVEAERDALKARVDAMTRKQIEGVIGDKLHRPDDFFEVDGGVAIDDLIAEDGTVDEAKVSTRLATITETRPHLIKPAPKVDSAAPSRGAAEEGKTTWQDALQSS